MIRCFLGVDIGTQGARVIMADESGNLISSEEEVFILSEVSRQEQSPEMWWTVTKTLIKKVVNDAHLKSRFVLEIQALSVTSTSGTVIPVDKDGNPLHNAIMYSDPRSSKEGEWCRHIAEKNIVAGYTGFNSSSGLSKMVWFMRNHPEKTDQLDKWIHAADFLTSKLSGVWGVTDYTNALKSGYDVGKGEWPTYLFDQIGLKKSWMPEVYPSGTVIGNIEIVLAQELGLSPDTKVTVGMTDGCASQVASGAIAAGCWNTTIGTTMVVKGVTKTRISDPVGRFYSHRHPQGYWMPGGASNTGADWLSTDFAGRLSELEKKSSNLVPSGHLHYPLRQKGERFPFMSPRAEGFCPQGLSEEEIYVSGLEGVAFLERNAYDVAKELSGENIEAVYTAGGGSQSNLWLRIRSSVLGLPIYRMKYISGAYGAAVLAASQTQFENLVEAGEAMVKKDLEVFPDEILIGKYKEQYQEFKECLLDKGYLTAENIC
ncbi:FGGY-family carbohydrate kinase [Echinicola sediminis]